MFNLNYNLYLLGFMGSGKSFVGKQIAEKIGWKFCDLDELIETKAQCSIAEIFDDHGEAYFRIMERDCLKEFLLTEQTVVALGGGTPCFHDNMKLIKGWSVFLDVPEDILHKRLLAETEKRPLLKGKTAEELGSYIHYKLTERLPFYRKANYIVPDTGALNNSDELMNKIINHWVIMLKS